MEAGKTDSMVRTLPFSRGVNFTKWFEEHSAKEIQFARYIEQDFVNAKSLGADCIRVPIKMHSMTLGKPGFALDPLLLKYLDTAIGWAEKHGLYIIIDNHSFDPVAPTDPHIDKILLKVWAQLAERYKDRGEYVMYEILNEPHGISAGRWGEIQGEAIKTIRKIDPLHAIIAGGIDYNSIGKLALIPEYSCSNLIYTFHFYDPHMFTHQGAHWGSPSLASLGGVPFPYDRKRMPKTPDDLKGTWAESALENYEGDSAFSALSASLDKAAAFSKERGVPVFCGEFGVYMLKSASRDRVQWYKFITAELGKRKIAWTCWDYFCGFGIFNGPYTGDFDADVNVRLVRAMGFTPPPQRMRIATL